MRCGGSTQSLGLHSHTDLHCSSWDPGSKGGNLTPGSGQGLERKQSMIPYKHINWVHALQKSYSLITINFKSLLNGFYQFHEK